MSFPSLRGGFDSHVAHHFDHAGPPRSLAGGKSRCRTPPLPRRNAGGGHPHGPRRSPALHGGVSGGKARLDPAGARRRMWRPDFLRDQRLHHHPPAARRGARARPGFAAALLPAARPADPAGLPGVSRRPGRPRAGRTLPRCPHQLAGLPHLHPQFHRPGRQRDRALLEPRDRGAVLSLLAGALLRAGPGTTQPLCAGPAPVADLGGHRRAALFSGWIFRRLARFPAARLAFASPLCGLPRAGLRRGFYPGQDPEPPPAWRWPPFWSWSNWATAAYSVPGPK